MRFVIDVNIILSALLKNSTTRRILFETNQDFYFPKLSLQKIRKYEQYVLEKSRIPKAHYFFILRRLLERIKLVPEEALLQHWTEAKKIMEHIDPEDVTFIAAALAGDLTIWSDDKHFQEQGVIPVFKTVDMMQFLK